MAVGVDRALFAAFGNTIALPLLVFDGSDGFELAYSNEPANSRLPIIESFDHEHAHGSRKTANDIFCDLQDLSHVETLDVFERWRRQSMERKLGEEISVRLWATAPSLARNHGLQESVAYDAVVSFTSPTAVPASGPPASSSVDPTGGISVLLTRPTPGAPVIADLAPAASPTLSPGPGTSSARSAGSSYSLSKTSRASSRSSGMSGLVSVAEMKEEERMESQEGLKNIVTGFSAGTGSLTINQLKLIIDNVPQMVFCTTAEGQLSFLNERWFDWTGMDAASSSDPNSWLSKFHPDDLPTAVDAFARSMTTGEELYFEYRVRRADGTWRTAVARGVKLPAPDGTVTWVATITDIEEHVRAKREITATNAMIRTVLEGAEVSLIVVDPLLEVTFFEGRLAEKQAIDAVGRPLKEVWHDPALEEALVNMFESERDEQIPQRDFRGQVGDKYIRYHLVPVPESRDPLTPSRLTAVNLVASDVTRYTLSENALQRIRTEQERLRASELAAKESSRLKTLFLSRMSHEIRTPLAITQGVAELCLQDGPKSDYQEDLLRKSLQANKILLELTNAVLDLQKVEAGKLQMESLPFKLSDLARDANSFAAAASAKGVTLTAEIALDEQYTVLGDHMRTRQCLANILGNAIKFTERGKRIVFRLEGKADPVRSGWVNLMMEVEDEGIGIDDSRISQMFVPFEQGDESTARKYGGTGVGLALVQELMKEMGGTVTLSSALGAGTRATLQMTLQVAPAPIVKVSDLEKPTSPRLGAAGQTPRRIRCLLAEDNDLMASLVVKIVSKLGYDVHRVANGAEAVAAISEAATTYDLILMDVQMPIMDGIDATKAIRALADPKLGSIPIVALTASAVSGDKERCLTSGMSGYVIKPANMKTLKAVIEQHAGPGS